MKGSTLLSWRIDRRRCALVFELCWLAASISSCQKPSTPKGVVYICRDRQVDVDPNATNGQGVRQDPVVLCGGNKVKWEPVNPQDDFYIDFASSPFEGNEMKYKKGDGWKKVLSPNDDTGFKYTITINNGKPHDPQIIIMGK